MKNRNIRLTAMLFVVALALAPIVRAATQPDGGPTRLANDGPSPDGGPVHVSLVADGATRATPTPRAHPTEAPRPTLAANEQSNTNSEASLESEKFPVITIHCTDNVARGKIGTFVLDMKPALLLGGMYVKFSVSGSAVAGVDYVALVSPAHIGQSGYGVIQVQTLPDRRGLALHQAYSVVVTLEDGAGYTLGKPNSAVMWIKP